MFVKISLLLSPQHDIIKQSIMKIKLFLFAAIFALTVSACGSDPAPEPADIAISVTMQCKSGDTYIPDAGAKIYLFKGFSDYVNYEYQNGTYVHNTTGAIVNHTHMAVANSEGVATMSVSYGSASMLVWESARYPGKFGQERYQLNEANKIITVTGIYFEP